MIIFDHFGKAQATEEIWSTEYLQVVDDDAKPKLDDR